MVSFGHQEGVTSLDALSRERCLTCGGRDRTARLWKIPEESQLVYRGAAASMDVVRWVADDCFVSGDDQGCVCRADSGRMGRP
jgi:ribosomal RNA-processing protein 9